MQFDFNVGANQSQHIDVVGTFIKYKAGAGTIRVRLNGGGYIDLLPGQGVNGVNFTSIDVQDRTGALNAGTILAGIYDFRDDRITGTVDVVDGGKARTLANSAFSVAGFYPADAANYSTTQIFNPAGSGKRVIIEKAYISSNVVGIAIVGFSNAIIAPGASCQPKLSGGATGAAQRAAAALVGLPSGFQYLNQINLQANQVFVLDFREPVVLLPGFGFAVQHSAVNASLNCTTEFFEEAI